MRRPEQPTRAAAGPLLLALTLAAALAAVALTGAPPARVARVALVGALVLAGAAAAGAPVLRLLRPPRRAPLDLLVLATALGTGVVGTLVLALAVAGLLRPLPLLAAVLVPAVAGVTLTPAVRVARAAMREWARAVRGPGGLLLLLVLFLGLAATLSVAVLPVQDWDTLMYHLRLPEQLLEAGRLFLPPDNPHVAHIGIVHMLYLLALAAGTPGAVVVVSAGLAALLGVAVLRAAAARSAGGVGAGRVAVGALAGSTVVAFVALTPRIDVTLALFLFLAHAATLEAAERPEDRGRLLAMAGLLAGLAVATKVHAGAYLIAVAVMVAWWVARRRLPLRPALVAALLALLVAGPWLVKNAVLVGDPVYPLLRGEQIPAWLATDPAVAAVADDVDRGTIGRAREPISVTGLLTRPGALSPEPEARHYVWSPVLLLGLLLVAVRRRAWPWAGPPVFYLAVLLLVSTRTNLRYLVPALPALAVAVALAVDDLLGRWPRRRPAALAVVFAVAIAPLAVPLLQVERRTRLGTAPRDPIHRLAAAADARLTASDTVLMLYDARGWPFEVPVLQDNGAVAWPLLRASGHATRCLDGLPVSHVLVNFGAIGFYAGRGGAVPGLDRDLASFVEGCLEPVARAGSLVLFQVARPPAPAGG